MRPIRRRADPPGTLRISTPRVSCRSQTENGRTAPLFSAVLLLAPLVLLAGCRSPADVSRPPSAPALWKSTDGALQCRPVPGWFRADDDSSARRFAFWLVRNDYGASLVVEEIYLDDAARAEVRKRGLAPVASLMTPLAAGGDHVATLRSGPEPVRIGRSTVWSSEFVTAPDGEMLRVTLVEAGTRIYAVKLQTSGAGRKSVIRSDMLKVERGFLEGLRW